MLLGFSTQRTIFRRVHRCTLYTGRSLHRIQQNLRLWRLEIVAWLQLRCFGFVSLLKGGYLPASIIRRTSRIVAWLFPPVNLLPNRCRASKSLALAFSSGTSREIRILMDRKLSRLCWESHFCTALYFDRLWTALWRRRNLCYCPTECLTYARLAARRNRCSMSVRQVQMVSARSIVFAMTPSTGWDWIHA